MIENINIQQQPNGLTYVSGFYNEEYYSHVYIGYDRSEIPDLFLRYCQMQEKELFINSIC